MTDLMRYAAALDGLDSRALPPVDKWDPARSGEIDIVIHADGTWFHEGEKIGRAKLVRLFSTILRRDGDDYFLVTPAEKLKITVTDAPFIAVLMETSGHGETQTITLQTNLGDRVVLDRDHPIEMNQHGEGRGAVPYVLVRRGLYAKIARSVFYDLVALGETRHMEDGEIYGVWSAGAFLPFGRADDFSQE